jgi:serine/threonine protein kinase
MNSGSTGSTGSIGGYGTPSPRARGKGFVGGRTSRIIPRDVRKNAAVVQDLPFKLRGAKWKRVEPPRFPENPLEPDDYVRHFFGDDARRVSAGTYGVTYAIRMTRDSRKILLELFKYLDNVLALSVPPFGSKVLLKLAKFGKKRPGAAEKFVTDNSREASAHVHLWRYPKVRIGGTCPVGIRPKPYVPRFYFFGIDMEHGIALTAMQFIGGSIPLANAKRITPRIFFELERALASFYAAGCDHSDMHLENILLDKFARIKVIDYGFAVRLPDEVRRRFARFYERPGSALALNQAAQAFSLRHTNAVQWKRYSGRLTFYNPTYAALRVVWQRMHVSDQNALRKYYAEGSSIISCAWKRN